MLRNSLDNLYAPKNLRLLIGVRVLTGVISAENAGDAYAVLAEELIRQLHADGFATKVLPR